MKLKTFFALSICATILLSGCGGQKSESSSVSSASNASSASVAENGKFVVGMECNYAPFNWTQPAKSDTTIVLADGVSYVDGYDVVMAKALADKMGKTLEIKKMAWEGLEPALSSGEIDAIIAGMTATEERKQNAEFTTPYYESDMVLIVRADDSIASATSIQEFSKKKVQGQMNTLYDTIIDQIKDVEHMTPLATYPLMVNALKSGDVDALTAELPVAKGVIATNPDLKIIQFEKGKGFEADTSVSIAVKKDNKELLGTVQSALDSITEEDRQQWMLDATSRQPANEA